MNSEEQVSKISPIVLVQRYRTKCVSHLFFLPLDSWGFFCCCSAGVLLFPKLPQSFLWFSWNIFSDRNVCYQALSLLSIPHSIMRCKTCQCCTALRMLLVGEMSGFAIRSVLLGLHSSKSNVKLQFQLQHEAANCWYVCGIVMIQVALLYFQVQLFAFFSLKKTDFSWKCQHGKIKVFCGDTGVLGTSLSDVSISFQLFCVRVVQNIFGMIKLRCTTQD